MLSQSVSRLTARATISLPNERKAGMAIHRYTILLGSNIDKEHNLAAAVRMLAESSALIAVSSAYETPPQGLREQPAFLNAAAVIESELLPGELKAGLLTDIEQTLKRVRVADKNAPRTIDLDIGLMDDVAGTYDGPDGRQRSLPDRDLLVYAHAAVPVAELMPEGRHPVSGELFATIADRLIKAAALAGEPPIQRREEIDLRPAV